MINPDDYEKEYVENVYNTIADEFNNTRTYIWNRLKIFINNIIKNDDINLIEVGSGNGKNLNYIYNLNNNLKLFGIEKSINLLNISKNNNKNINYQLGDNLNINFNDNTFDYTLSIAVIHHFSTLERRLKAIEELIRITKINGIIFIQVWAFEQKFTKKKFNSQDQLIQWIGTNNININRYYYLFKKGELEELVSKFNITIIESFEEHDNYGVIIKKTS